ncbi:hypothetical protein AOQ88_02415 [Candidatus Riesia sp. GBBU]|nr:hypothetical protein AOQ88_02035 [Candidatus Riesia sp. GBBU]ARC55073.1 hypothetical protein AOQ88_02415 [Candidatus Riesia sp. GBBU]
MSKFNKRETFNKYLKEADYKINIEGLLCMSSLYLIRNSLIKMRDGEKLLVISNNTISREDIPKLCYVTKNRLIKKKIDKLPFLFLIQKTNIIK